ncbi:MAG TPA: hypothetical protein VD926_09665 [Acidimicrobiales bacterium]|nr:hypothetical protein [Acidimicrobiales bacterium]
MDEITMHPSHPAFRSSRRVRRLLLEVSGVSRALRLLEDDPPADDPPAAA